MGQDSYALGRSPHGADRGYDTRYRTKVCDLPTGHRSVLVGAALDESQVVPPSSAR